MRRGRGARGLLARAAAGALAALGAASCASDPSGGYSFSAGYRSDVRTISAPIFENRTFEHGVESSLTEAIVKEIHRVTPYGVTTGPGADTTLSGVITRVNLRQLTTDPDSGLGQEMAVEITVDFEWRDNRTGRPIVRRRNFRAASTFVPSLGVGERPDIGRQGAVESLARDLVASLRSDW